MKFCYVTNIFDLHITTPLLMIHLKCAVVHYASLNSSSINKSYLRAVEYAISLFFSNSYLCVFQPGFCQKRYEKTIIFNANFQSSYQDVVCILQNIRM